MDSSKLDKEMMTDPSKWPKFPYLPLLRRKNGKMECGVLVYDSVDKEVKPVVLLANIHSSDDEKKQSDLLSYESFDYLLDDGWEVD
ncbi:MAG: hypothetical protein ACLP9S_04565 [Syntrophales bacterium]